MIPALTRLRASSIYPSIVLADNPAAFWKLNETSGTVAYDSSGNGLNGTYTGGYTLGNTSSIKVPGAVKIRWFKRYVNCGSPPSLNFTAAWTLEIWASITTLNQGSALIAETFSDAANVLYSVSFNTAGGSPSNTLMGGFYTGTWTSVTGPVLNNGVWNHVVVTWDNTTLSLYVNGVSVATNKPGVSPSAGMNGLYLGRRWDAAGGSAPYFNGLLAAAAIYGTALPANRISAHYNAGV